MMMEDRELLEMAAKAAGIPLMWLGSVARIRDQSERKWNPLEDDGDAFRLAVYLGVEVFVNRYARCVMINRSEPYTSYQSFYDSEDLIYMTTRQAIVIAAAKIGKSMP